MSLVFPLRAIHEPSHAPANVTKLHMGCKKSSTQLFRLHLHRSPWHSQVQGGLALYPHGGVAWMHHCLHALLVNGAPFCCSRSASGCGATAMGNIARTCICRHMLQATRAMVAVRARAPGSYSSCSTPGRRGVSWKGAALANTSRLWAPSPVLTRLQGAYPRGLHQSWHAPARQHVSPQTPTTTREAGAIQGEGNAFLGRRKKKERGPLFLTPATAESVRCHFRDLHEKCCRMVSTRA